MDYTLWNPDHPSGSAFYGEGIENLPMLEAGVHAEYSLRNRLVTLNQNVVALPAIEFSGLDSRDSNQLTFEDGDSGGKKVVATLKGYASSLSAANAGGIYFVIQDPTIVHTNAPVRKGLSGTTRMFLREQDIPSAQEYHVAGGGPDFNIGLIPDTELLQAGRKTNIYVVHIETGAYHSFTVVNNITRLARNVLSQARSGRS